MELDLSSAQAAVERLGRELVVLAKKGRYTRVRFKFRGKALLPDLPLAAVVAAEGLTFYWAGILRALVVNVAGRSLLEVELVNDSEKELALGKEALLSADVDVALRHFERARDMDPENPRVHLNLGVAHKLEGRVEAARAALEEARRLGAGTPTEAEAERLLGQLPGGVALTARRA